MVCYLARDKFFDRIIVFIAEHSDKETAVRYAIVKSLIAKLEFVLGKAE